ncbi:MAG: ImmA/IrrE family metallo-endopeptidase [Treponema sp.]
MYDDYAPLIFINGRDAPKGKLFSLIHEFIHILRSETDIINENHFLIENLCNKATINFLTPEDYIKKKIVNKVLEKNDINNLSNYFKVSFEAICYRLCALNYISKKECNLYISEYAKSFTDTKDKKQGGNYWNSKLNVLSKHIAQAIISELHKGNITYTECFKMLGVSGLKTFKQFENRLSKISQ